MPKKTLTSKFVETATSGGKERELYWDASTPGFGLMVTNSGARSFVVQYRNTAGQSRRLTINGNLPLTQARREARAKLGEVAKGGDPLADKQQQRDARADTLRAIVENEYLTDDHIKRLRTSEEKRGIFERHLFKPFGARPVTEIKRSEIVRALTNIRSAHGPGAARNALKALSAFYSWYMPRSDDDFRSPIVKGLWRHRQTDGARTLTDDEIRILWQVTSDGLSPYDHLIRFTLLTATRKNEAANVTRTELSPDGTEWTIPAARYKGVDGKSAHAHLIPLSALARQVLDAVPVLMVAGKGSKHVFTADGRKPMSGFSQRKRTLDQRLLAALAKEGDATRKRIIHDLNRLYPGKGHEPFDGGWQTHSLRKTARTLFSRLKISTDTAERCLGHVQRGIIGTYNHHDAREEKRIAFEALAREIERIVDGKPGNVVPLLNARA